MRWALVWAKRNGLELKEFGSNGEDGFNWVDLASQRTDVALFSCTIEAWNYFSLHGNEWKSLIMCFGRNKQWLSVVLLLNTLQCFDPHFFHKYSIDARLIFTENRLKYLFIHIWHIFQIKAKKLW